MIENGDPQKNALRLLRIIQLI